jgi:hypothetical protein
LPDAAHEEEKDDYKIPITMKTYERPSLEICKMDAGRNFADEINISKGSIPEFGGGGGSKRYITTDNFSEDETAVQWESDTKE